METKKPLRLSAPVRDFRSRQSYVNRRFLLVIGLLLIVGTLIIHAAQPGWWTSRDAVDPSLQANDFAVVNQGQLKQFTQRAVQEMNATLPGGAGIELNTLVTGWQQEYLTHGWNATTPKPADFTVMTVGQVKHIANKVWTRLVAVHYSTSIPGWLPVNPGTDSQAANLGQLKTVFNFTLTAPEGQLPDWWQRYYFNGQTGILPGGDEDTDDLSNFEEYQMGTNPGVAAVPDTGGLVNLKVARPW